ncbi:MAG: sigma-70 family RNA polymerase sigma factor [Chloroflexia bacterium]
MVAAEVTMALLAPRRDSPATAAALDAGGDEALILEAQRGSLDAFNRLVRRHERAVYNVALRLVGTAMAAEEVTQDTFMRAYGALERFRGGDFRPWLLRIATNRAYDELRRRKRAPGSFEELTYEPEVEWSTLTSVEDPDARAERLELAQVLEDALAKLPNDQRVAVVLSDVQGYDYVEIAAITGVPYGTVKSRLSRARSRLRTLLAGRLDGLQPVAAAG